MLVHLKLIVIATVIVTCQAFWWSSYPQTNTNKDDSQMIRPISFGYFRSYAYQPIIPYHPYMIFPQLLTNIPSRKSQKIGKTSETIDEKEKSKLSTISAPEPVEITTATTTPVQPASISMAPSVSTSSTSQTIHSIPAIDAVSNSNMESAERKDQKYFDSFQRIPSWTFRHNDIHAEQQPAVETELLKNSEAKQKIQYVPCMCPISIGAPISTSIGPAEATDAFTENKIRRFEDLGEIE